MADHPTSSKWGVLSVKVELERNNNIILIGVYGPVDRNDTAIKHILANIESTINKYKNIPIYIAGDLNVWILTHVTEDAKNVK